MRGIVAAFSNLRYWGCELREEQVVANRTQAEQTSKIYGELPQTPEWVIGDSRIKLDEAPNADFPFSCPSYGNLEGYKGGAADLSGMSNDEFLAAYEDIIAKAASKLRDDRFACLVVGDYRDKDGYLCGMVTQTVNAFEKKEVGMRLYNAAVLRTPVGNAAMRAEGNMTYRKLTRVHQDVLVFCKGVWKKAAAKNSLG